MQRSTWPGHLWLHKLQFLLWSQCCRGAALPRKFREKCVWGLSKVAITEVKLLTVRWPQGAGTLHPVPTCSCARLDGRVLSGNVWMCLNLRSPSRLQLQVLVALRMPVEHTVGLPDPSGSSVTMETCAASSVAASAALAGSCLSSLAVLQTGPLLHQQRHQRQHGSGLRLSNGSTGLLSFGSFKRSKVELLLPQPLHFLFGAFPASHSKVCKSAWPALATAQILQARLPQLHLHLSMHQGLHQILFTFQLCRT